MIMYQNQ